MKKQILFLNLILTILIGFTMTSCSSDEGTIPSQQTDPLVLKPAKAPEFSIYSGGRDLTSTRAGLTRAVVSTVGTFQYTKYGWSGDLPSQYRDAMPDKVSKDEMNYVENYMQAHPDEAGVKFYNINYFVQYAGGSYITYSGPTLKDQNNSQHYVTGTGQMDYIEINGNHLNDYNSGFGPDALCQNLPLINPAYHDSYGNIDNTKYDAYKIYKITYKGKEGYYLGFDYKTKKSSGEYFDGDGVYNDYVIKLTPADDTTYGNGTTPGTASTNGGEVEVNLSINAEKSIGDYIATKLSIHVRDTTDAEVYIPAPAEYYCQADDMNIVLSHKQDAEQYNNTANNTTMTYNIAGQNVTLKVAYELNGIRVTSSGINATIMKYLRDTYGDGLTFEVWNYYNSSVTINGTTSDVTRGMLKNLFLEKSTVKFPQGTGRYINAFGAINDYKGIVYENSDPTTGIRTPYTDQECTQELDAQYWDRLTTDTRYYVLHTTPNAWDCKVLPSDASYTLKETKVYNQIYEK